ncbi:MAG: glycoside hydrolase/phage tail family protein [Hyphomicrobiales bacterium]
MATLVLGSIGSAVGGTLGGPTGAIIGKAVGSFAGSVIDNHLFGTSSHTEARPLQNLDVQTSTEGAAIPLTFGRTRLAGQIIWATRYEEVKTTTRHSSGGKGGGGGGLGAPQSTTTTYSYFANFAIGLCEGPIASIGRVWADGKPLDRNTVTMRVHRGGADQSVDPLIASKEGTVPAFKDTTYVVFERMPLEGYGNRLPQLSFEIIRPVGGLEDRVRAITMIPGATEFGYHPDPVVRASGYGVTQAENTHDTSATTDWHASLDQLQALCPNLERVALVVAWFGTSLDAATCKIEPRVERQDKTTSIPWSVAGLSRSQANTVSLHEERPAYGSTPSDASVIAAIGDLKARGIKVTLMPFIMMDVPADNTLTDPWTGASLQPAYPWRGQITVSPAPGQGGSPDATASAASAVGAFVGTQNPPASEWSFRRFLLHMADLCAQAGGVDAFMLGSEMRGISTVRDAPGSYPFVDALVDLAADVRAKLGAGTILTYGADWTEYANHQLADGSGDLTFHLDPLWASPNIDVIGIDQYQPITDWRHDPDHLDRALGDGPHDPAVIEAGLTGGENHDWYYASDVDRAAQVRTPITDGAYNEPWVFASKDLVSWWSKPHHNRIGGVRQASSTAFVPGQKPLWLTEFGAPAVDLGGNQPSAFPSDKPDNDSLPFGSKGYRDDAQQRAILDTALKLWGEEGSAANPLSPVDGRAMIDPSAVHLWTWDARPFPLFPYASDVWSDGVNWTRGHWLNGRLGAGSLGSVILALCEHFDLPPMDVGGVHGMIDGYTLSEPTKARRAFDDLSTVFALDIVPKASSAKVTMRKADPLGQVTQGGLVAPAEGPLITVAREDREMLPRQVTLGFASAMHDYQTGVVRSARADGIKGPDQFRSVAVNLDPRSAGQIAERMRQEQIVGAATLRFTLPPSLRALEPGDVIDVQVDDDVAPLRVAIDRLIDGAERTAEAHCVDPSLYDLAPDSDLSTQVALRPVFGPPDCIALDLPSQSSGEGAHNVKLAAFASPWPGSLDVYAGSEAAGFDFVQSIATPSVTGVLVDDLAPGPVAYPHRGGSFLVDAPTGSLSSITQQALLAGGNLAALVTEETLEVIQFASADLMDEGRYRVRHLVRGLGGTEDAASNVTPAGARFVMLDENPVDLNLSAQTLISGTTLRVEPHSGGIGTFSRTDVPLTAIPRNLQPLAPVHLRTAKAPDGAVTISWIRRSRGATDLWELASTPLNEEAELYRLVVRQSETVLREEEVTEPHWTYSAADQASDGISSGDTLSIQIAQLGTGGRLGALQTLDLTL